MSTGSAGLLGREAEVADVVEVLTGASGGYLAVVGPAGIGKSVVLAAVCERLRSSGIAVRTSTGAVSESDLPFVGLHDLIGDDASTGEVDLPAALWQALDVALLRAAPAAGADPLAIDLAVLKVLEHLSAGQRLVLALDDLLWVDAASRAALAFALRRLPPERVSLLVTMRPEANGADVVPPGSLRTIMIEPLDAPTLGLVVERRTGSKVPHRLIRLLHDVSGGNPLLALELVRGVRLDSALAEVAVPERYRAILSPRLAALSRDARGAVLAASLLSRPTLAVLADVVSVDGLLEAEAAGVIRVHDDRVAFTHPLFAALSRELSPSAVRRDMHARLAKTALDEVERARHLGSATLLPDEDVAGQIEAAGERARGRAAIAAAAELALLAQRLTPPGDLVRRTSRGCAAGVLFRQTGDIATAADVVERLLEELDPGPLRARTLAALAAIVDEDADRTVALLDEALRQPGLDSETEDELRVAWTTYQINLGDLPRVRELAVEMESHARTSGRADIARKALYQVAFTDIAMGTPPARSRAWSRMLAEADEYGLAYDHPDLMQAWEAMSREDHLRALELIDGLMERARRVGNLGLWASFALHRGEIELRRGRIGEAVQNQDQALRILGDGRHDEGLLSFRALSVAWQGRLDEAREDAEAALVMARQDRDRLFQNMSLHALGFIELSDGRTEEAAGRYEQVAAMMAAICWRHPSLVVWHGNAVEALVSTGRRTQAARLTAELSAMAQRFDLATSTALALRCQALLLEDAGQLEAAVGALNESVALSEPLGTPLEHARTLLVRGVVQRRRRQKALSRADLQRAQELFGGCGALVWAARAARELERSAAVAAGADLTTGERSVAELAATGATNREIAASLYLSEKTVEAVLTRVYRKLAVRSRTELGRHPELAVGAENRG